MNLKGFLITSFSGMAALVILGMISCLLLALVITFVSGKKLKEKLLFKLNNVKILIQNISVKKEESLWQIIMNS
jgi:hypothetical protein